MSITATTKEQDIINALISIFAKATEPPTKEQVELKAKQLAPVFEYCEDLNNIVVETMISIDTKMGAGISLVENSKHDDQWVNKREEIKWIYTKAYEEFLRTEGWAPQTVQSLSDVTSRILGHLQDPTSKGATWSRKGLVIGHVQSGKTANYTGLIARAADAGYKFIIVLAGIHNNLRKQTQERIDEAFIGRSSDPENRRYIGVGLDTDYPHPATLTNIHEDFNKNTATKSGWKINDFSKPIVLVIKKNVTTLSELHKWLKELNAEGDGHISDVPMLLIDDEADNASINTNKEELDPTRTNSMIRQILKLFAKSCYVGYTATPFANIFINPNAYDDDVREELFPRHFIYCLDAPTSYFGSEKVFLNEEISKTILRPIIDCEPFIPLNHKREYAVHELPPSLYDSIYKFIIARAIRNMRGQHKKHCSMMINVSRFVPTQKNIRDFVSLRVKKIRDAVIANYMMPEDASSKNVYMQGLKKAFEVEYSKTEFSWNEIKISLISVFDNFHTYVINSKSDEQLDYRKYEKEGVGLTAIAVGGFSLSRGLTMEGLTISYMYRNTKMYDTLMQMGRWFGYRPNYEDICRVHLSQDSIDWYSYISEASEELVQQIKQMRLNGLSPEHFGFYVRSHSKSLLITAANKMRSAEEVTVSQNLTGQLVESTSLPLDVKVNEANEQLLQEFWKENLTNLKTTDKGWFISDIDSGEIEEFLIKFKCHKDIAFKKQMALDFLRAIKNMHPKCDVLFISKGPGDPAKFILGAQDRTAENASNDEWNISGYRVASRGDEKLGLLDEQLKYAQSKAASGVKSKTGVASDYHYRLARNKPLLMLHVLTPVKNQELSGLRVPAFGISFPDNLYQTEIKVVVNKVFLEKMQSHPDSPDEEENY